MRSMVEGRAQRSPSPDGRGRRPPQGLTQRPQSEGEAQRRNPDCHAPRPFPPFPLGESQTARLWLNGQGWGHGGCGIEHYVERRTAIANPLKLRVRRFSYPPTL